MLCDCLQNWIDAHGGSSGGWDERDHALFVRLRLHTSAGGSVNVRQLTQRAVAEIPEQTADSVAKHIQVRVRLVWRCALCLAQCVPCEYAWPLLVVVVLLTRVCCWFQFAVVR